MTGYTSKRYIDGKVRTVIVNENGNIINRNPGKEELKGLEKEVYKKSKRPKTCCICRSHDTYIDLMYYEHWHKHRCQKIICTGYLCESCYKKHDPNSNSGLKKSVANRRTGNLNQNSSQTKGDKSQELACELYGWVDLNKENDNYSTGTPIDCYDPKTGLYHQVQGHCYNSINRFWPFTSFEREQKKNRYEDMVCFCFDRDRNIVERIYKFPLKEIMRVKSITIYKNPSKGGQRNEQYRIVNKDELKNANEIWKKINNKRYD